MKLLCLACGAEVTTDGDLSACPECGSTSTPADLGDMLSINISTHELRILTFWAERWAAAIEEAHPGSKRAIQTVTDRLAPQTSVALTFSQEVADLRSAYPDSDVKVYNNYGEEMEL